MLETYDFGFKVLSLKTQGLFNCFICHLASNIFMLSKIDEVSIENFHLIYRVFHKGWDFRDDCIKVVTFIPLEAKTSLFQCLIIY